MDLLAGVTGEAGVVDLETEIGEVVGDEDGVGLLLVDTEGESLDTSKEEERVERRESVTDRVDRECDTLRKGMENELRFKTVGRTRSAHLGDLVSVAADNTSHEVVVTTEVFGSRVVHDVGAEFERSGKVRAHHRVVDDDDRVLLVALDELCNRFNVCNLQEGVCRGLEEDHGDFLVRVLENGKERLGVRRVDVVSRDAVVLLEVADQSVRSSVEIVSCDDVVSRLEQSEDDIERAHTRSDGKGVSR